MKPRLLDLSRGFACSLCGEAWWGHDPEDAGLHKCVAGWAWDEPEWHCVSCLQRRECTACREDDQKHDAGEHGRRM